MNRLAIAIVGISISLAAEVVTRPNDCAIAFKKVSNTVHKKHSKETLRMWKEWGEKHPNWKPRKETLAKIAFACTIEPEEETVSTVIPDDSIPRIVFLEPEPETTDALLATEDIQPPVFEVSTDTYDGFPLDNDTYMPPEGGFGYGGGSVVPPPPVGPAVPEPTTLALFGTGILGIFAMRRK